MRKTLIIVIAMLISASALYATGQVGLNPWHGGFGIDMATTEYNFDSTKLEYINPSQFKEAAVNSYYSDTHMIALGGVWNMESTVEDVSQGWWEEEYIITNESDDSPMKITAECPNGFYFESISNPGARRPFELYLLIKESYSEESDSYSQNHAQKGKTNKSIIKKLGTGENIIDHTYNYVKPSNYEEWDNLFGELVLKK